MDHQDVIATLKDALIDVPEIRALFLSGSYGNGRADEFSDIDFVLVSNDGASDATAKIWRDAVSQTGEIVLWWDRTTAPVLINAITADWTRTDVIMLKPDQLGAQTQHALAPVFDHDGLYDGLAAQAPKIAQSPAKFLYEVQNFIRILGLMHLAVGREEYINGVLGTFLMRNALVELMIAETDAPDRGGILHLNRLITAEQKAVLTALPAAVPTREGMVAAQMAYAAEYLPRARKMAMTLGVEWPERFEAVTWAKLDETLGLTCPYRQ